MRFTNMKSTKSSADPRGSAGRLLRLAVVGVIAAVAVSGACYHFLGVDLLDHGTPFSFCPFRAGTGLPCPGCGMTRAMLSLGQGKLLDAVGFNPFSVPLFAGMMIFAITGAIPLRRLHTAAARAALIAVLAVWLARLVL